MYSSSILPPSNNQDRNDIMKNLRIFAIATATFLLLAPVMAGTATAQETTAEEGVATEPSPAVEDGTTTPKKSHHKKRRAHKAPKAHMSEQNQEEEAKTRELNQMYNNTSQ